jgi:hypothetical protein
MAASNDLRPMTVAVYLIIELEVEARGEADAIYVAAPQVHELEAKLNQLGYNVEMKRVSARRPSGSEPAKRREEERKRAREG